MQKLGCPASLPVSEAFTSLWGCACLQDGSASPDRLGTRPLGRGLFPEMVSLSGKKEWNTVVGHRLVKEVQNVQVTPPHTADPTPTPSTRQFSYLISSPGALQCKSSALLAQGHPAIPNHGDLTFQSRFPFSFFMS